MKTLIIILFTLTASVFAGGNHAKVVTDETRSKEAKLHVKADVLGLYVKGLICESCGLGVKKKTTRLKFVDKTKLSKGIKVDAKHQLLYIAITQGQLPNYAEINKAIKGAGYEPMTYYVYSKGKVTTQKAVQ